MLVCMKCCYAYVNNAHECTHAYMFFLKCLDYVLPLPDGSQTLYFIHRFLLVVITLLCSVNHDSYM